jgi:alpha-amylase/alpha-mannosidase (GH57 family)
MALKPAESLTDSDREFLLRHSFYSDPQRMIYRYPRYGELFDAWRAQKNSGARSLFGVQEFRDLQMWSQLSWFDEEFQEHDPEVRGWIARGRSFTLADQRRMGEKQRDIVGKVLPEYQRFAATGQIEISTTPYYHPILPLLCDSNIAGVSHPHVPLPPRFRYPQDARRQLELAREYIARNFGVAPVGLWPSEGSVSDEALHLAAGCGFRWFATDNGVLARTLNVPADPQTTYKPYVWKQGEHQMSALFRDHYLSDLIGFVYSRMGAAEAAKHFLTKIRENCRPILASGRDALVPIILDGENAWEYYEESGRPFLRELYRRIADDPAITATTVSEALALVPPQEVGHIFPASWINANFDIWIGAEEDNRAWEHLSRARDVYERADVSAVPAERRRLAHEELLIAEGSDWCWWYGPEHESANRPDFDRLFRSHLANVYTLLGMSPPDELSRPILRVSITEYHQGPTGPVKATVDGEVTSYFEWLGAGVYRVDSRSGAMHGQRFLVQEMRYGSDGQSLFVRLDFVEGAASSLHGTELRVGIQGTHSIDAPAILALELGAEGAPQGVETATGQVCEVKVSLAAVGVPAGHDLRFQLSLWRGGLPMEALPPQGWIEFSTAEPADWMM